MTDQELTALWPQILTECRKALMELRATGQCWEPEEVANDTALSLWRYERVTSALIARIARSRAIDLLRRVRGRYLRRHAIHCEMATQHEPSTGREREPTADASGAVRVALSLALPRERRVVLALVRAKGNYRLAARRIHMPLSTFCAYMCTLRARILKK